jgi:O-antigen/teichoic acid export membrane protein
MQEDATINRGIGTSEASAVTAGAELHGILNQVSRNTVWLVLAQLGGRAIGLIYVLVMTRFLSVGTFGFYSLLLSFFAIAEQAADLGLSRLTIRDLAREPSRIPDYVGIILPIKIITTVAVYLALPLLLWTSGYPPEVVQLGAVGGLILIPSGQVLVLRNVFHSQQRFVYDALVQLLFAVVQSVTGSVVLLLGGGLPAVLWATTLVTSLYLLVLLRGCWRRGYRFRLRLNLPSARGLLRLSLPYAGISLLTIFSGRVEPIVLGRFADSGSLGLFGAAAKITDAATFLPMMFGLALTPIVSRYHADSAQRLSALFFWSARAVLFVMVPGAALAVALAPWVINLLFPPAFLGAAPLLRILFAAQPIAAFNILCGTILFCSDRQHRMVLVLAGIAAVQIALDLTLIPAFGAEGAASAIFATQGVTAIVMTGLLRHWFLSRGILVRTLAPSGVALAVMISVASSFWGMAGATVLLPAAALYLVTFTLLHFALPAASEKRVTR